MTTCDVSHMRHGEYLQHYKRERFFSNSVTKDMERPNASRNRELIDRYCISAILIQGPNLSFSETL